MTSAQTQPKQILLTGATGFIGGTILNTLLSSQATSLQRTTITCLIRGDDRAEILISAYGSRVRPVVYKGLDDLEATTAAATEADIVIGATLGFHPASAQALLRGLGQRRVKTGREVWMIHLSGASNLSDRPVSDAYVEDRTFDDVADDIYAHEQSLEAKGRSYPQRATELGVVNTGLALGVRTIVMMPPTIYGVGTGLFNRHSVQIPAYVRAVLELGRGVVIGEGKGEINHVHVEDLAELYLLAVRKILEKEEKEEKEDGVERDMPTGKKGIWFAGNGLHTWMDVARGVADACYQEGLIASSQVESIGLEDAGKYLKSYMDLVGGDLYELEVGLCANSRTAASVARNLGWKPSRGEEAWKNCFREDVRAVLERC